MIERLAHRDLRNRSSEILREVASGATFEITNHGKVVAILSPPPGRSELRVRPRRVRGGFGNLPHRVRRSETVQEALDDLRGDR